MSVGDNRAFEPTNHTLDFGSQFLQRDLHPPRRSARLEKGEEDPTEAGACAVAAAVICEPQAGLRDLVAGQAAGDAGRYQAAR